MWCGASTGLVAEAAIVTPGAFSFGELVTYAAVVRMVRVRAVDWVLAGGVSCEVLDARDAIVAALVRRCCFFSVVLVLGLFLILGAVLVVVLVLVVVRVFGTTAST